MEEQDDEVEMTKSSSTSSWLAAEGTLEQSVKVVGESEDAIYTAGETSRLVLTPPPLPSSSSSSSSEKEPCELTVTFQQRLGHVHQIYVISTARICEIYGQKEQDGDREYVCTIRGGVISLSDYEGSADDSSEGLPDTIEEEDFIIENFNSSSNALVSPAIPKLESGKEVQQISLSEGQSAEVFNVGKIDSSQPVDDSPSLARSDSKEELFRSFTEAINGRDVDGSMIFEESLEHANWVDCPLSPFKSSISASDDETEIDASTSEFCLVDTDVESQQSDQPQVRLFTDAIRASGKNSIGHSLERGNTGSSGHSSWQEATEESILESDLTNVPSPDRSKSERNSGEGRKVQESSETPLAQVEDFADDFNAENLPGSGFCVFEVNQDRDGSSSPGSETPCNTTTDNDALITQVAEARSLETQSNGDMESRFPFEAPVFECEVSLVDADAWASVTIRLLSIKSKSQVEIHRVVVTYTPGPIEPRATNRGSFQQGVGTSSLLTMLVPGILQMARGMSETRIAKNSSVSSPEKETGGSDSSPVEVLNDKSSSLPASLPTVQNTTADQFKMNTNESSPMVDKSLRLEVEEKISSRSDVADGTSRGTSCLESIAQEEIQIVNGGGKDSEDVQTVNKETGHLGAHQKEERVDELVQRLDRLETICLRMESSLTAALENMDKRLKLLESGGLGTIPPALGHPIWGPGFDSGSFVSATSVYVPAAHTGAGTPSLMDSQIPFSMGSEVDVPVGENSTKGASSTEPPVYPGLLASTSPQSLSAVLPSWPLSSWPHKGSPDLSSHSSGLTATFISKRGLANRSSGSLHDSDHPSNGGETFWESRTSEESESDISSDSEQTSYADNCEDSACGCCPESVLSSPTKPVQLVDNALASALSAFSASFGAQNKSFSNELYHTEEGSDEEDSFTREEQVPLVELDSFPSYYEKEEVAHRGAEDVFLHGYEAIPLSSDKDMGDLSNSKVILEDSFWSSEVEENQEINWQDEGLQTQEEKIFLAVEDYISRPEEVTRTFQSSAVFIEVSDKSSLPESATVDTFSADIEKVSGKDVAKETKEADPVGANLQDEVEDLLQNPFLQDLIAGAGRKERGVQSAWHHQSWTGDQAEIAKKVLSSCLSVRDPSNPLNEEVFLEEGLLPDEWNWFTSEFSPFSSLMDVRDLSEDAPADKEPVLVQKEIVNMLDGVSSKACPSRLEPWSLLDDDISMPSTTEQFGKDMSEQDWPDQKSQWSLLDEYPPDLTGKDKQPDGGSQDNGHGNREPRSLLDEDIPLPSSKVPDVEEDVHLFSSHESLLDNLTDVFRSSEHVDMSHSPSSQTSKSNPFEDEHSETLDFSQGSNDAPLVLLEELEGDVHQLEGGKVHQFEAPGSEGTQSLMFHMSL